jgi:hypothetical protein
MQKVALVLTVCVAYFHIENYCAFHLRFIYSTCRLDMTKAS